MLEKVTFAVLNAAYTYSTMGLSAAALSLVASLPSIVRK